MLDLLHPLLLYVNRKLLSQAHGRNTQNLGTLKLQRCSLPGSDGVGLAARLDKTN